MKIIEKPFKNWTDAKQFIETDLLTWSKKYITGAGAPSWIFRGLSNANYELCSSIERIYPDATGTLLEMIESHLLMAFDTNAHNYTELKKLPRKTLERHAILQHYGAPTRLVDWTYSPYIAAYFAFENRQIKDDQEVCIWAMDMNILQNFAYAELLKIKDKFRDASFLDTMRPVIRPQDYFSLISESGLNLILSYKPDMQFQRMTQQQGLFLFQNSTNHSFMEGLANIDAPDFCYKIKISCKAGMRLEVLRSLQYMGINSSTIYPGFEGFVRSLSEIPAFLLDDIHAPTKAMLEYEFDPADFSHTEDE